MVGAEEEAQRLRLPQQEELVGPSVPLSGARGVCTPVFGIGVPGAALYGTPSGSARALGPVFSTLGAVHPSIACFFNGAWFCCWDAQWV